VSSTQGFELHPGAAQDISEIWQFIAEQNLRAAKRVREDVLDAIRKLVPSHTKAMSGTNSPPSRYASKRHATT
jgi:plasmid stabilization system protein ParE